MDVAIKKKYMKNVSVASHTSITFGLSTYKIIKSQTKLKNEYRNKLKKTFLFLMRNLFSVGVNRIPNEKTTNKLKALDPLLKIIDDE